MKHNIKPLFSNKGFSIVSAIFVLVILSLLGLAMVTINAVLQTTSVQASVSAQAYYTAVSGVEWATYQATGRCQDDHDAICGNVSGTPTTTNFNLNGFAVTLTCDNFGTTFNDGNGFPYDLDSIVVTASKSANPGSPDQISRTIRATVTKGKTIPAGSCI